MFRRYLSCFLAMLIALQSVVVMADAHQLHQLSSEHQRSGDVRGLMDVSSMTDVELNKQSEASRQLNSSPENCHHNCHCQCMPHLYLFGNQISLVNIVLGSELTDYNFTYLSYTGSADNPPPIS
jgi:hypothetical protein